MATKINVRSPFYLKVAQTNIATATLNLYIYTGTFVANASVANPKYTITKSVVTSGYIVFEVAELIRDYLDITFNGTYDSQVVWVNAIISTTVSSGSATATVKPDNTNGFVAFDGYGYYEDGANPTNAKTIDTGSLQSNQVIFRLNDENVRVPVYTGITDSVTFLFEGTVKRTQSVSTSTNTNAQIDYITVSGSDNTDNYRERVLADGGTLEDNTLLDDFLCDIDDGLVDELYVNSENGTEVIKIKTEPETKYTPIKVTFVNKFGALQDLHFSLKSIESLNTTGQTFKSNLVDFTTETPSYVVSKPQVSQYDKLGKESITLNTGYLSDDYEEVIKQLLLSEQVFLTKLTDRELVLPIIPKTSNVTYKTTLNDRLVQYTIEFDYAFDKINTIR